MRYFDENRDAYCTKEQIENEGKACVYECSTDVFKEFLEGKRIWSDSNELVLNPDYEIQKAQQQKEVQAIEIQKQIDALELKRTRAIAEPGIKDETTGQTWLEYRTQQIQTLREELQALNLP